MLKMRSDAEVVPVLDGFRVQATFLFTADEVNRLEPEHLVRMRLVSNTEADLEFWFIGREVKKYLTAEKSSDKAVPAYLAYKAYADGSVKGYLFTSLRQLKNMNSLAELKVKSLTGVKLEHPSIPEPDQFEVFKEQNPDLRPTLDETAELTPLYIKSMHRLPVEAEVTEMFLRFAYLRKEAADKGAEEPTQEELLQNWVAYSR